MASRNRNHNIGVERKVPLGDPMLTKSYGPIKTWVWVGAMLLLASLAIYFTFGLTNILNWITSLI